LAVCELSRIFARIKGNGIACANPRFRQSLIKGEKVKPNLCLTPEALFAKKAVSPWLKEVNP